MKKALVWLSGVLLWGCTAQQSLISDEWLEIAQISATDTPQKFGQSVVGWYPDLGYAVLRSQQATPIVNQNSTSIAELPQSGLRQQNTSSLGNTWSTGWQTWSSGWHTWGSGGSVLQTGQNLPMWQQIRLPAALSLFPKAAANMVVAVLDTGIDMNHPAFAGRLVKPYDFVDLDTVPQETQGIGYGHGTNVAGIVAQVAGKAKIMPVRVLNAQGIGSTAQLILGINWAVANGAHVINLSLGAKESSALELAIRHATSKGVFVVSAAGNTGGETVQYPAFKSGSDGQNGIWGEMAIGVSSVDTSGKLSKVSSYDEDKVGVLAPGELVYAPAPDLRVAAWSGTSMATPVVAAALALGLGERSYVSKANVGKALRTQTDPLSVATSNSGETIEIGQINLERFGKTLKTLP
jgi:thermitase